MTYNELSVYGRLRKIEYVNIQYLQTLTVANTMEIANSGCMACGKSYFMFGVKRFPRNRYSK